MAAKGTDGSGPAAAQGGDLELTELLVGAGAWESRGDVMVNLRLFARTFDDGLLRNRYQVTGLLIGNFHVPGFTCV